MGDTPLEEIPQIVNTLRNNFLQQRPSLEWRKQQIQQVIKMIQENRAEICDAVSKDLGSIPEFVNVNEAGGTIQEAKFILKNLDHWVKPEIKPTTITTFPAKGWIAKEPYGVALIISPWNYPFRLATFPLLGAIAAGNAVVIKPSEVSVNTSKIIKKLFEKYLDNRLIRVVEGGIPVSSALLSQKFDYIFYTGNTEVGRIVMRAASANLTPVTLELGGKSPVYIDNTCHLPTTISRILFGKFSNAGQTCIAPDYLLVQKDFLPTIEEELKKELKKWYGENPKESQSFSRIINPRHTSRLVSYLEEVKSHIVQGGKHDIEGRYLEPTIVKNPPLNSKLMQEEIFGPILPIIPISGPQEAIQLINSRPKPLALYIFSKDEKVQKMITDNTSSGGVCINATIFQIVSPEIQFGGVGDSGMGAYNGRASYETFTHRRGMLDKATWPDSDILYAPYTEGKRKAMRGAADGIDINLAPWFAAALSASVLFVASKL